MPFTHRLIDSYRIHLLFLAAVAGACEANGPGTTTPEVQAIQERLTLMPFDDCSGLEQYIEDAATKDMQMQLDQMVESYYRYWMWDAVPSIGGADTKAGGSNASAPTAYTKTNTQVAGVDEADFMKNDGTRIFVLSGQRLVATRSWPPQSLSTAGALGIEGHPREMFLDEKNRVVVISDIYAYYNAHGMVGTSSDAVSCWVGDSYACWGANVTKLTVVDVTDIGAMKTVDQMYMPGWYRSSRRIGSSVRVVLSDAFRWPMSLEWYPPYDSGNSQRWDTKDARRSWATGAKARNEAKIRAATLREWLPRGHRRQADGTTTEIGYNCRDFSRANAPVRLGIATVATVNLDKPGTEPARTAVIGEVGEIFASQTALYLASWHWWWWPVPGQADYTYLHKLDITDPDRAVHVASGGVEGHIVDQFSMDEDRGFLRVATTLSNRVLDPANPENIWGTVENSNRVSVLAEQSGVLGVVGRTPEIARGERIYSSRFVGDKGFLVTFRQIDPLFTLDMSRPTDPRVVGELKVPGFSTYIHPLDAGHLLTIGVDVPTDPTTGTATGERRLKLTIFDVTDFAQPREAFTQIVGSAWGWSEATYEHKAFNYFPEKKLLAIPFSDWLNTWNGSGTYWDSFVSDVRVFEIDAEKGITPKGSLGMKDVYMTNSYYDWTWWYSPWIRRSVMASDDAGQTFVYAVSDSGIRVANLASISTPLGTALIPPQAPIDWKY